MSREQVLRYLQNLPADRILSGQALGWPYRSAVSAYSRNIDGLYELTGCYPAILSTSWGFLQGDIQHRETIPILVEHWNCGGLVQISWHADNPWTSGNSWDTTRTSLLHLFDPNQSVSCVWDVTVERLAGYLAELRDAGVIVLWRPMHEMNYTRAFWWDAHDEYWAEPGRVTAEYKALWQDLHRRFTNDYGLDNLIWTYAPSYRAAEYIPANEFYPGDDWVDVVGYDYYSDTYAAPSDDRWQALAALGKPVALTEAGSLSTRDGTWDAALLLNMLGVVRWFNVWYSFDENAISLVDVRNADELLKDPRVINRGEIELEDEMTISDEVEAQFTAIEGDVGELNARVAMLRAQADEIEARAAAISSAVGVLRDAWARADALADEIAAQL